MTKKTKKLKKSLLSAGIIGVAAGIVSSGAISTSANINQEKTNDNIQQEKDAILNVDMGINRILQNEKGTYYLAGSLVLNALYFLEQKVQKRFNEQNTGEHVEVTIGNIDIEILTEDDISVVVPSWYRMKFSMEKIHNFEVMRVDTEETIGQMVVDTDVLDHFLLEVYDPLGTYYGEPIFTMFEGLKYQANQ